MKSSRFIALSLIVCFLLIGGVQGAAYISQCPSTNGVSCAYSNATVLSTSSYDGRFLSYNVTNPALSLTGGWAGNQWLATYTTITNQRLNFNLGSAKVIENINYANSHTTGVNTNSGAKTFLIYGSNLTASFLNVNYTSDTGWVQIGSTQSTFDQHINTNVPDYKNIPLYNTGAYQYYSIKIADGWGSGEYLGLRRINLQSRGVPKYYAYGDSVTAANTSGLSYNGTQCYILQMRNRYDPNATADHNMDGGGFTSRWGLQNIGSHYTPGTSYFVILFGINDAYNLGINATETAMNLKGMYNYVKANGTTPIVMMHTLENPTVYDNSTANISVTESLLTANNIPFGRMYDALDTHPLNFTMDAYDGTYIPDHEHPNPTGHIIMANYVWNTQINNLISCNDMTSNSTSSSGCVVNRSSVYDAGHEAYKSFNGVSPEVVGNGWSSSPGQTPSWISMYIPGDKTATGFGIEPYTDISFMAKNLTFSGSNDNHIWTQLFSGANITNWSSSGNAKIFSFANTNPYKYYNMSITANNGASFDYVPELWIYGITPPISSFTSNATSGVAPRPVKLVDTSTNTPTAWNYSFRDVVGNNTVVWFSTAQQPEIVLGVGNYSFALNASNTYGYNTSTQNTYINVSANNTSSVPIVQWVVDKTVVMFPGRITANDTSLNEPTAWIYSWGDNTTNMTTRNGTHQYVKRGVWNATLTVSNAVGSNTSVVKQIRVIGYAS